MSNKTKDTKPQIESEIKLKDLSPNLASTIITICIVGIIMMILFSWAITNLQNQIKDLPHNKPLQNLTENVSYFANINFTGKFVSCSAIYVTCPNCSDFTKEQKQGFIIGAIGSFVNVKFPITISLGKPCIKANATYYNINELPTEDVCYGENKTSCLWRFNWSGK